MEKEPQIIADEIHLLVIENTQFRLLAEEFKKAEKHHLGIAHRVLHNLNDQRMKLELILSFKDNENKEVLFLQTDYHFQVDNLTDFYEINDKNIPIFFSPLIATILGISLSTSRGILSEKLNTSGIHNVVIPVVSPINLLQKSRS